LLPGKEEKVAEEHEKDAVLPGGWKQRLCRPSAEAI